MAGKAQAKSPRNSSLTLSTSRDMSLHSSTITAVGMKYLQPLLPPGWQSIFRARRAGKFWGLMIECPHCEERPPKEIRYGSQRWRWLSTHLAVSHGSKKA